MPVYDGVIVIDNDDSFTALERYANKGGLFSLKIYTGEKFVYVLTPQKEVK